MTYDQLLMLEKVVETGGFSRAAKALHVSQPSISTAIKKLESTYGIEIFCRKAYRPTLTQKGAAFYQGALLALNEMKELHHLGQSLARGLEPKIKIAINDTCSLGYLLDLLQRFFKQHDKTKLELMFEGVRGAYERVVQKDAHLGISPLTEQNDALETISLGSLKLIPVCSKDHPAAGSKDQASERNLRNFTQVIVRDTSIDLPKKDFGVIGGQSSCTVNDNITKKEIIKRGLGWGRLPDHLIKEELKNGSLVSIESKEVKSVVLQMKVLRRKQQHHGIIAQSLWQMFSMVEQGS